MEVLHFDAKNRSIVPLIGWANNTDSGGQGVADLVVAGVEVKRFVLNSIKKNQDFRKSESVLRKFVDSEEGEALMEAVPAMYAALESIEQNAEVARLRAPFGAVVMALQLSTGKYGGFKNAEKVLGSEYVKSLRDACQSDECLLRGKSFLVHQSGLFDVLTKQNSSQLRDSGSCLNWVGARKKPSALARFVSVDPIAQQYRGRDQATVQECLNSSCFGFCGPNCITPGDFWTAECYGHDTCVCNAGILQCLVSVPENCTTDAGLPCASLLEALGSYFSSLLNWLLGSGYNNCADGVYSPTGCPTP